jgi:hypothetical protein
MKVSSLIIFSLILAVSNAQLSCANDDYGQADVCPSKDYDGNCCARGGGDNVCAPVTCPPETTAATTGAETTTGATEVETTCVCPSYPLHTVSPDIKNAGGTCECTKGEVNGIRVGVTELRFVYYGNTPNTDPVVIELFRREKEGGTLICKFEGVIANQEVSCALDGSQPGLVLQGLADFDNETPFVVTYSNGDTCEASYHTSCSSDIVNVVLQECTDLVCTGWNDGSGQNCDDDIEPCPCNNYEVPPSEPEPTSFVDIILGEHCYCDVSGQIVPAPTEPPKSKAKKSKSGKHKSKDSGGLGVGDCDCEGGQIELTLLYQAVEAVDIEFWYFDKKSGNGEAICANYSVEQGAEVICNVQEPNVVGATAHDKLGTNTFVQFTQVSDGAECQTEIHTSCSRDIVGTFGDEDCGAIVSGWRDGNNVLDDAFCDDGFEECNCNGTLVEEPNPVDDPVTDIGGGVCFCSHIDASTSTTDTPTSTYPATTTPIPRRRMKKGKSKSRDSGYGWGNCDCDGGVNMLRFVYKGDDAPVDITLFYDGLDSEVICTRENVLFGQENNCSLQDDGPLDEFGVAIYFKMQKETFVRVTGSSGVCEGQWHTSCSKDIVGWTAVGCEDVIISGWSSNNNGECDDGYEPCECTDCSPYSIFGDPSQCQQQANCYVDEGKDICTFRGDFYTGQSGANSQSFFMSVVMVVVAVATATAYF